ncbi:MAG TPA: DNA adenine methylase, partial [Bacteroidetes bacterium]|nr:DNA adenine methylase [Bacteroidota bacterium]
MKAPQPIPYQGSKRALAPLILKYFPKNIERLIEPFAGSAAISIATAIRKKADKYWINDLNKPLIDLLSDIVNNPERISSSYKKLWEEQLGKEKEFFIETRKRFNNYFRTDDFL